MTKITDLTAKTAIVSTDIVPIVDLDATATTKKATLANLGKGIQGLNATNCFSSGTVPTARLGSGSATSSTYLRGDQTWASVSSSLEFIGNYEAATTETTATFSSLSISWETYSAVLAYFSVRCAAGVSGNYGIQFNNTGSFDYYGSTITSATNYINGTGATTGLIMNTIGTASYAGGSVFITNDETTGLTRYNSVGFSSAGSSHWFGGYQNSSQTTLTTLKFIGSANMDTGSRVSVYAVKRS